MSSQKWLEALRRRRALWLLPPLAAGLVVAGWGGGWNRGVPDAKVQVLSDTVAASNASNGSNSGNSGCGNGNGGPNGSKDCGNPAKGFTMTGTVTGLLAPGVARTLTVRVTNPNSQDMQVMQVTASVGAPSGGLDQAGKPACSSSWVSVPPYSYVSGTKLIAPAYGSVDVPLTITLTDLPSTNQDNCKTATFPITLAGSGQQVH